MRQGSVNAHLLNLAHPQDGGWSNLESDHPLRTRHEYSQGLPYSIWDIITYLPETSYSTSYWTSQERTSRLTKHNQVWLTLSIQPIVQSPLASSQLESSSVKAMESLTSVKADIDAETASLIDLSGNFIPEELPDLLVLTKDLSASSIDEVRLKTIGDVFDPKWKNPAQRKFDRQMERLAAQNSWDITPGPEDQTKLDHIEHKFAAWAPLTEGDKDLVWKYRGHLKRTLKPLFLFASCVKWNSPAHVEDAMNLIYGSRDVNKEGKPLETSQSSRTTSTPGSMKKIAPRELKSRSSIVFSSLDTSTTILKTPTRATNQTPSSNQSTPSTAASDRILSPSAQRGNFSSALDPSTPTSDKEPRSTSITPPLPSTTPTHDQHLQRSTSASKSSSLINARSTFMEEAWKCSDVIDVLPMLTWRHAPALRKFIIQYVLKDANLEPIILQVIHALKYEDAPVPVSTNDPYFIRPEDYNGISFERIEPDIEYASFNTKPVESPVTPKVETPLLDLLIDRASVQPLGYYIYWYMSADQELATQFDTLRSRLKGSSIWVTIEQQMTIHDAIKRIGKECITMPDDLRVQAINEITRQCGLFELVDQRISLPLHPSYAFRMIRPTGSNVFNSNNKPIKLTIEVTETSNSSSNLGASYMSPAHLQRSSSRLASSTATSPSLNQLAQSNASTGSNIMSPGGRRDLGQSSFSSPSNGNLMSSMSASTYVPSLTKEYDIIYKHGDDLRHDQLMMLLIRLIDRELQRHNLDLNFVSYDVLPFSINDGIMTCITKTMAIEDIRRKKTMSLSAYLRKYNPTDEEYERALETYAKSCAGNCVLNMVLGWGDRHAANLLVAQDGHLVHIDFGFILGHEPNWNIFKIMLSLTDYMLEPLGTDPNSKWRRQFYSYAHDAYQVLRKFGHRILSILYVMRSALAEKDVPDSASLESINFVRDRLNLVLNDDDALAKLNEALESAPSNIKQSMSGWWRALKHG